MTQGNMVNKETHQKAWIVFTNHTEIGWLKIFKRGYRHCFIILNDGERWISIDPMAHYMDIVVQNAAPDFNLISWLERRGHSVLKTELKRDLTTPSPAMIYTCVEACKRILGIQKRSIFTPWQLHQHLKKQNEARFKSASKYEVQTKRHKGELLWEV